MKVAINQRIQDGPWGGGNRFASALVRALQARGDRVIFDLEQADIDLVLLVDPRPRNPLVTFTPGQLLRRLLAGGCRAVVVHRINECDERKGTRGMNRRLKAANLLADHTVFIGSWLRDLDLWQADGESSVILNGADNSVFHPPAARPFDPSRKIRLVTHHWGGHRNKGFDVYSRLCALMDEPRWQGILEFTYVGNLPDGVTLPGARILAAQDGDALADELRRHDIYVTASLNEPAGMHHIEGALCGLPLLFRNSGALPEYCRGFGEMFEGAGDVEAALERLLAAHGDYQERLRNYPHTSARMTGEYLALFDRLLVRREELIAARRLWAKPLDMLLTQLPF